MICIVDFDGTFFKNDFFKEQFFKKILENPYFIIEHFIIKRKKLLDLKIDLLSNLNINYDYSFLINPIVLKWIEEKKLNYNKIILVSASPDIFLKHILKDSAFFNEIHGSVNKNLKGNNKLNYIKNLWGDDFDYLGDSKDDIPIFKSSKNAFKITSKGIINVYK